VSERYVDTGYSALTKGSSLVTHSGNFSVGVKLRHTKPAASQPPSFYSNDVNFPFLAGDPFAKSGSDPHRTSVTAVLAEPSKSLLVPIAAPKKRLWIDEDDVAAMQSVLQNISYKNLIHSDTTTRPSAPPVVVKEIVETAPSDIANLISAEDRAEHSLSVGAAALGVVMIIFFVGLTATTFLSGIVYIHPLVGIGGCFSGIVFLTMHFVHRRERVKGGSE
jgi:hypothetical protein